jgi:hypothetical protein
VTLSREAQAVAPEPKGVQDDPPQLVLHLPDRGLGGGHDRPDHQLASAGSSRLSRTRRCEASDGGALKGEVLVDGAGPGAGGSAGADAIQTDPTGGELEVGVPWHARQCSRPPRLG